MELFHKNLCLSYDQYVHPNFNLYFRTKGILYVYVI